MLVPWPSPENVEMAFCGCFPFPAYPQARPLESVSLGPNAGFAGGLNPDPPRPSDTGDERISDPSVLNVECPAS